jgi:cupin fold WbuC family metalloprotein
MLIEISQSSLSALKEDARVSSRKRLNHNYHKRMDDPINRMTHAMNPGTYVQPHKHESPDKREVFILLSGKVAVVEFDDTGCIVDSVILDHSNGKYGVEIPPKTWHSLIALEPDTLVYEIKDGPYSPVDDKNFAPWAPAEDQDGGRTECQQYLNAVLNKLGLNQGMGIKS